jgi:formate hydrogenlyase subunit 3/multisubunit Na+/H+ antiporter MnhD subunit
MLIILFSVKFMANKERTGEYYAYLLVTLGAAAGAFFAGDYLALLLFWGVLAVTLYLLIGLGGEAAGGAAMKTLIIVGGADALMIVGLGLVWLLTRSLQIGAVPLPLNTQLSVIAFLCLLAGALAKAGAMPFHGWVPESSEVAPATVMAFLPAALDKLLGIYFLARLCVNIFPIQPNTLASFGLLSLGSLTIMAGVLGALWQHNFKKLLAWHAISQVGYMVVGLGTGLPLGLSGGLFHMFNNTIYKSCLFLTGGAVESRTGTTDLDKLGGLAKFMPLTFTAAAVAALSISGIPPFNGFFSKWLIYQGIFELSRYNNYWIIWLVAAMFGSALTLASFVKLLHATFLGQWSDVTAKVREVSWSMWLPPLFLAALCLVFGLWAVPLPLRYLVWPTSGNFVFIGWWAPGPAAGFLLLGLLLGLLIYLAGQIGKVAIKPPFIGTELLPEEAIKVSGTDFYDTVKQWWPLATLAAAAEQRTFDFYHRAATFTQGVARLLGLLHNGLLHTYLAWLFLGFIVTWLLLVR